MKYPGQEDLTAQIASVQKTRSKARLVLLLAIIGMVVCSVTGRDLDSISFAKDWLITEGVMLKSSIVRTRSFKFPAQTNIHPDFVFSYIVDGKPYESDDTTASSNDEKVVGDLVSKFPSGTKLLVHYRAAVPTTCYFEHDGVNKHTPYEWKNLFFILGLASIISALLMAIKMQKARRREQESDRETRALMK